jgi:hypothetical protein
MPLTDKWNVRSVAVTLAFFGAVFLFYTPFEDLQTNTMWPRYFAVGVSILCLLPIMLARPVRITVSSMYILVGLLIILLHTIFFKQISFIYPIFVGANILIAVLIYEAHKRWPKEFNAALGWLLAINLAALFVQIAMYYLLGGPIVDLHEMVFNSPSRDAVDFVGINRFSGIQVEPGTYANNMAFLLAVYLFTSGFRKRVYWISILTVLSMLLTGSATSVYFMCVLLVLLPLLWSHSIKTWHVFALFVIVLVFLGSSNILDHLDQRFAHNDDGSMSIWKTGLHSYLATGLEEKIIGLGYEHPPCVNCYFQNMGVIANLLSGGGLLMLMVLVVLFFRLAYFNGILLSLVIFAMPLNSRMYYYEAPVWMLFLFAQTNLRKKHTVPPAQQALVAAPAVLTTGARGSGSPTPP